MTHGERFPWQCAVNDNCREKLFLAHVREHKAYGIFLCGKLLTHNGLFLSMSKTARYLFLFVLH